MSDGTEDVPGSGVGLSGSAIARVKVLLEKEARPMTAGLRVSVVGGGCSGMQYHLALADASTEEDQVYECEGVRVFVDPLSAQYVAGMVVDFVDGLHGAGFRFVNPNAERTCGCGSSFSV